MASTEEHLVEIQKRVASIPPNAVASELKRNGEALVDQRGSLGLHFAVGLLYARVGDLGSAAKMLNVALNISGENKVVLGALAFLFANQVGDDETALTYLKRRHKLDKKDPSTLLIMAHCNLKLEKAEEALNLVGKAEKLTRDKLQLDYLKAQALVQLKRYDEAWAIAEAMSTNPHPNAADLSKTINTQIEANRLSDR